MRSTGSRPGPKSCRPSPPRSCSSPGNVDGTAAATAQAFYDESVQPKRVEILTTADHGTDLLEGNQGEIARNLVTSWIQQHVSVT